MFRENYTHLNKQINPDKGLIHTTIDAAQNYEEKYRKKTFSLRRPIIVFASVCLCISLTLPALAATVDPVYQLMYLVSPAIAQFFMPVSRSDENNGIRMEVVSAYIHENTAELYVTMQDLTGDRIDGSIDLYDSYSINRPFDSLAHCELVGYEKDSKTATFLITMDEWGEQKINGDKITFTVNTFLSRQKIYPDISIPIDLSNVLIAKDTQTVSSNGGGGKDYKKYIDFEKKPAALIPSEPMGEFPVDGIALTGIGYINGSLHIQTAVKEPLDKDNHGYFYLVDSDGNKVNCSYNFYFSNQSDQPGRIDYCNYVFDIPQEKISNYTLQGYFETTGMKTDGNWRVTFPLEKPVDKNYTKQKY